MLDTLFVDTHHFNLIGLARARARGKAFCAPLTHAHNVNAHFIESIPRSKPFVVPAMHCNFHTAPCILPAPFASVCLRQLYAHTFSSLTRQISTHKTTRQTLVHVRVQSCTKRPGRSSSSVSVFAACTHSITLRVIAWIYSRVYIIFHFSSCIIRTETRLIDNENVSVERNSVNHQFSQSIKPNGHSSSIGAKCLSYTSDNVVSTIANVHLSPNSRHNSCGSPSENV